MRHVTEVNLGPHIRVHVILPDLGLDRVEIEATVEDEGAIA